MVRCQSQSGCRAVRISHKIQKVANWNADVGGLYQADNLHLNSTGNALEAELIKPAILAERYVSGDSQTVNYLPLTPTGQNRYGIVVAGDSATINNVSVSGFANDGILIQADSPTIKNTISSGNAIASGNNVRQSLTGATLSTLTEDYNNFRSSLSVNGSDPGDAVHSLTVDPLFTSATNLSPVATSTMIDAGTDVSLTTDYLGNSIYGLPDIGGYEYQPPHTMGTNEVDIGAGARVYGDGKFRDVGTTNATTADLSITPSGGTFTETTSPIPAFLDISNITNWTNTHKTWTESNAESSGLVTDHTIGDLTPNKYYNITVSGIDANTYITGISGTTCSTVSGNRVCKSDNDGKIYFRYNGGYSDHTFDLTEGDNTAPVTTANVDSGTYGSVQSVTLTCADNGGVRFRLRHNLLFHRRYQSADSGIFHGYQHSCQRHDHLAFLFYGQ